VVREVKLDSKITIRRLHNKRKKTPKKEKPSKRQKLGHMTSVPPTAKILKPKKLFSKNSKNLKEKKRLTLFTRKQEKRYINRMYNCKVSHNHNFYSCTNNHCVTCTKQYVINLSSHTLTEAQISLLSKGLTFVPTANKPNHFELLRDLDHFFYKIQGLLQPSKKHTIVSKYLRKKIKQKNLNNKKHKNPMGLRPIVSNCNSLTKNLSQFVDYWLQPIMKAQPSYLKNSTQLINELRELNVKPNTILVTIDVKSLYACIPHSDGIKACLEALTEFKENCPSLPDPNVLTKLLEVVLTMNTFEFNNVCYQQLQGCAMGTTLAPAYANIFMGKLEKEFLSQATTILQTLY